MATQGMVTIVKGGKVVMKIVAGSDGYNAGLVADVLRAAGKLPTKRAAYQLARKMGMGHRDDLVVINQNGCRFEGDEDLHERYRRTFDDPRFNPRWEHGTADHIEIVQLE